MDNPIPFVNTWCEFSETSPGELVLLSETGSRAYGTHRPDSDYAFKGIYVARLEDVLSVNHKPPRTVARSEPHDVVTYELAHFAKLAGQANPTVLELLWSPGVETTDRGLALVEDRALFLSKRILVTYGGYAMGQLKKFRAQSGGSRGVEHYKREKFKVHTLRLLAAGHHALTTGDVLVKLAAPGEFMEMAAAMPDDVFERSVEGGYVAMQTAAQRSKLPDEPDWGRINRLVYDLYRP